MSTTQSTSIGQLLSTANTVLKCESVKDEISLKSEKPKSGLIPPRPDWSCGEVEKFLSGLTCSQQPMECGLLAQDIKNSTEWSENPDQWNAFLNRKYEDFIKIRGLIICKIANCDFYRMQEKKKCLLSAGWVLDNSKVLKQKFPILYFQIASVYNYRDAISTALLMVANPGGYQDVLVCMEVFYAANNHSKEKLELLVDACIAAMGPDKHLSAFSELRLNFKKLTS